MKIITLILFAGLLTGCSRSNPSRPASRAATPAAPATAPLRLLTSYPLDNAPAGHFDHLAIDLGGGRLFSTDEGGAIEVVDLASGKILHTITNDKEPHGIVYRPDVDRLYVTDGDAGLLRIYSGKTYQQVANVKLWPDADSVGFNPADHTLYVDSGGAALHQPYSHFSAIDTTRAKRRSDMHIDANDMEAMQIAPGGQRIYLNLRSKAAIAVIDPQAHKVEAEWPIQGANNPTAMALDEADHLLFVGCRSGQMVIFDTQTGQQVQSLPLGKMVDDMVFDGDSRRVYAACDGSVYVFEQRTPTQYQTEIIRSAALGKTALLVPSLHRYFVAVPKAATTPARILVFEVN